MPAKDLISIIVPCHNEDANIVPLHDALQKVCADISDASFEFIFIDDGSTDDTVRHLRQLSAADHRVRIVELVRNFGKEIAITAGIHTARGKAAICLDADLQHPPTLIPSLIEKWRAGYEVVIGVMRTGAHHAPLAKRLGSGLFYKMINIMTDVKIVAHATDYR